MNAHLLAGRLRTDLRGILIYAVSIVLFMLIVLSSYSAVAGSSALVTLMNQLPSAFKAMFGGDVTRFLKLEGYIGVGYLHPITIALLAAFSIGVPVNAVAGEIDRGTINLLLARPVRRRELVVTAFAHLLIGLVILSSAFVVGTWLGLQTLGKTGSGIALGAVAEASLLTLLLFLTVGSYSLVFSAASSDSGRATLFAAGTTLILYFVNYLSQLTPELKSLGNWSLFHYWDPSAVIINNRVEVSTVGLYLLLSIVLTFIAVLIFERRDIAS